MWNKYPPRKTKPPDGVSFGGELANALMGIFVLEGFKQPQGKSGHITLAIFSYGLQHLIRKFYTATKR